MQLHTLQRLHPLKTSKPRVGRGGKRGTYSGRGQKGQKAHAGRRIPTGLKELIKHLPKLRGFKNKPTSPQPQIINLDDLALLMLAKSESVPTITRDLLFKQGLIGDKYRPVKILGNGKIEKPIIIEGLLVSRSAKEKIEALGGHVRP